MRLSLQYLDALTTIKSSPQQKSHVRPLLQHQTLLIQNPKQILHFL